MRARLTAVHPDEHLGALRTEAAAFVQAIGDAGPEHEVPSCPGWTVHDLITHCLRIYRGVDDLVRNGSWDGLRAKPPETGTVGELEAAVGALVEILEERPPEHEVPNWSGSNFTARFWRRRMAQETAVHRWDVQSALGDPDPVEVELAVDGIDEILDVFLPRVVGRLEPEQADLGGSLHVHATDSDHGEWIVRLERGELLVGHAHEKADAAVRGTASDLLLLLWGRDLPPGRVQVLGETAVVDRWRERIRI